MKSSLVSTTCILLPEVRWILMHKVFQSFEVLCLFTDKHAGNEERLWRSCCHVGSILCCCQTGMSCEHPGLHFQNSLPESNWIPVGWPLGESNSSYIKSTTFSTKSFRLPLGQQFLGSHFSQPWDFVLFFLSHTFLQHPMRYELLACKLSVICFCLPWYNC